MVIKKIPLRMIKREFLQFLSIMLLVAIATMTYTLFAVSMQDIDYNYEVFKDKYNQEDGNFITAKEVDLKLLKDRFGIRAEERLFVDAQEDNFVLRVFSIPEEINKPYIEKGRMPSKGEILVDPAFYRAHNLTIGSVLNIGGQNFRVSGIAYLPDYIYIIKNDQDFLPDPEHFGFALMNGNEMKKLFNTFPVHYYCFKGRIKDIDRFKEFLNSNWELLKFMQRDQNPRIMYTEIKVKNAKNLTLPLSLFIIFVSSFILFIVMRRVINTMHAEIGTIYSMGYAQKDVLKVFMKFPLYIWLFGSVSGVLLGIIEAAPFARFYRSYFTLPEIKSILPWQHVFVAMLMPAIFIFLSGYLAIKNFFKLTIVQMLHGIDEIKFGKLPSIKFFDRFEFKTRIMLKYGWRHMGRELILAVGIIFSTILMMYGLTAKDAIVTAIEKTYEKNFKYSYLYLLNSISKHSEINMISEAEPFNLLYFDVKGTRLGIAIYGIKSSSEMIELYDEKGKEIPVSGELIITRPLANKLGVGEGDRIKLKNKFTGKEYTLKIGKVADLPVGNNGYMELESFNRIFGYRSEEYAGIFSKEKLEIPPGMIFESYAKAELVNTIKSSAGDLSKSIGVMALIAAILALLIVYVLSTLTLNENKKNIGILKMLGYREGSIFKMILGFNYISFFVGFAAGIPLSRFTMDWLMSTATRDIDFAMSLDLSVNSILSTFAILLLVFLISRFLARQKIAKVMPVEILRQQVD
ncbi:ABC transporter permease [Caldicellulosiruptor morganii]|uniref:FtsX-like permease family protein n=1 Tax=Caldicellulosiruptor morganii TaxID=1387555 RepID=A0ABY7BRB4_9FIRM|nr:FtsX-like permease family protein [Caldicellulosiruptor morganii]WAM33616.1 FtsX-like permease family protein [Caldicellulosiruptor morganii]